MGEDVEPYFGRHAVERERGCHRSLNLDFKESNFFLFDDGSVRRKIARTAI